MKIDNIIVVPHDDLLPEPVWLIFGLGLSGAIFIDSASCEEEAYDIIDTIKEKIKSKAKQNQEEVKLLFDAEIMRNPQ